MLKLDNVFITESKDIPVVSTVEVTQPGSMVVAAYTPAGKLECQPSTGVVGEIVLGMAVSSTTNPESIPHVADFVAGTTTAELGRAIIGGTVRVVAINTATGVRTDMALGDDANANEFEVAPSGTALLLNATTAAASSFEVHYRGPATLQDFAARQGHQNGGGTAATQLSITGVILKGTVGTSMYDTTTAWDVTQPLTVGANGRITQGGPGTEIDAFIEELPTQGSPYLVLTLR